MSPLVSYTYPNTIRFRLTLTLIHLHLLSFILIDLKYYLNILIPSIFISLPQHLPIYLYRDNTVPLPLHPYAYIPFYNYFLNLYTLTLTLRITLLPCFSYFYSFILYSRLHLHLSHLPAKPCTLTLTPLWEPRKTVSVDYRLYSPNP